MDVIPTNSADARRLGAKQFYPGYPCPKGHDAPRRTTNKRCVECHKEDVKNYRASEAWRAANIRQKQEYKGKSENAIKIKARNKTNNEIRSGRLVKQPCEKCGTVLNVHAHHDDYTKPLEVMWLCPVDHRKRHLELDGLVTTDTTNATRE